MKDSKKITDKETNVTNVVLDFSNEVKENIKSGDGKMAELKKETIKEIAEDKEDINKEDVKKDAKKIKEKENKEEVKEKDKRVASSKSRKKVNKKNNVNPASTKIQIYKKNIEEETIFNVEIDGAKRDEDFGDIMLFKLNDTKGIVSKDEADDDVNWNSLIGFIGNEISVVIKEYDEENDRLICSRKEAQKIIKSKIISELSENDEVKAKITKLTYFGAFVEIHGVSGILKNEYFSNDHISVGDVFKVGEILPVQLLRVNQAGKLYFKVPVLYKKSSMVDLKDYEVDQVIKGPVVSVKEWGFYVRLLPGVDILVPLPRDEEVFVDSYAIVKLTQIFDDKNNLRMRGKLIKFLSF